jgi:hypothetical protein
VQRGPDPRRRQARTFSARGIVAGSAELNFASASCVASFTSSVDGDARELRRALLADEDTGRHGHARTTWKGARAQRHSYARAVPMPSLPFRCVHCRVVRVTLKVNSRVPPRSHRGYGNHSDPQPTPPGHKHQHRMVGCGANHSISRGIQAAVSVRAPRPARSTSLPRRPKGLVRADAVHSRARVGTSPDKSRGEGQWCSPPPPPPPAPTATPPATPPATTVACSVRSSRACF